jgi:hypothetical protein
MVGFCSYFSADEGGTVGHPAPQSGTSRPRTSGMFSRPICPTHQTAVKEMLMIIAEHRNSIKGNKRKIRETTNQWRERGLEARNVCWGVRCLSSPTGPDMCRDTQFLATAMFETQPSLCCYQCVFVCVCVRVSVPGQCSRPARRRVVLTCCFQRLNKLDSRWLLKITLEQQLL